MYLKTDGSTKRKQEEIDCNPEPWYGFTKNLKDLSHRAFLRLWNEISFHHFFLRKPCELSNVSRLSCGNEIKLNPNNHAPHSYIKTILFSLLFFFFCLYLKRHVSVCVCVCPSIYEPPVIQLQDAVAASSAERSRSPSPQQPPPAPQGELWGERWSLQHVLDLPHGLVSERRAWNTSAGRRPGRTRTRCPTDSSQCGRAAALLWVSSGWMSFSPCLWRRITLRRKLISATRISDLILSVITHKSWP